MRIGRLALICASAGFAAGVEATIANTLRDDEYHLSFSGLNFSGAAINGDVINTWTGSAGDSTTYNFNVGAAATVNSWTGDSNVGVVSNAPVSPTATGTITMLTNNPGMTDLNWSEGLTPGVSNGLQVLDWGSSSPGYLDNGYEMIYNLYIPGDWSNQGTGPGQSELLSYNSGAGWVVYSDFVYHSVGNYTLLGLDIPSYQNDGNHNVDLQVQLNGAAVPEPFTLVLGGAAIAIAVRRRRR